MATILETPLPKRTGGHRKAIYPYDEWLDGQVRSIKRGKNPPADGDFSATVPSMRSSLSGEATNRGVKLATRAFPKHEEDVKNPDGSITVGRKTLGLKPADEGFIFQAVL